jgi:citrate lyase subunit beta/citryl-CoA lyase
MARRSVLFAPGDQPELLAKAQQSGADVTVFDLEDAVDPDDKPAARKHVVDVLEGGDAACERCVRVNPVGAGARDDLSVVLGADRQPDSLLLPKVGSPEDVHALADLLAERTASLPVVALLETAAGVLHAEAIAATAETDAVVLGAEDLAADIGATRTAGNGEISYARQHVVLAAGVAGVDAIDTLYTAYEDLAGLRAETAKARDLGFDGKLAIHPAQVPVINTAFTPGEEAVAWARRVVAASEERGDGVFSLDGEMIDAPLVAQAETVLERAGESVCE